METKEFYTPPKSENLTLHFEGIVCNSSLLYVGEGYTWE